MLPEISRELLARMAEESPMQRVEVGVGEDGRFTYTWSSAAEAAAGEEQPATEESAVATAFSGN